MSINRHCATAYRQAGLMRNPVPNLVVQMFLYFGFIFSHHYSNTPELQYSIMLLLHLFKFQNVLRLPLVDCNFLVHKACQCEEIAQECLKALLNNDFNNESIWVRAIGLLPVCRNILRLSQYITRLVGTFYPQFFIRIDLVQ
jgi:hypothetical protein